MTAEEALKLSTVEYPVIVIPPSPISSRTYIYPLLDWKAVLILQNYINAEREFNEPEVE